MQQVTAAAMEQLLKKSPGLVNERYTKDDYTLLHIAILARNEAVAKVLIDNASDLEIQDDYGRTPLLLTDEKKLLILMYWKYIETETVSVFAWHLLFHVD